MQSYVRRHNVRDVTLTVPALEILFKWIKKLDKKEQDWLRILRKFEYCEFKEKQDVNNIPEGLEGWKVLTDEEIKKAQDEDEILKEVLKWVTEGQTPNAIELRGADSELQQYKTIFNALEIQDGLLCMKFKLNDNSIALWSRTKSYIILTDFNLDDLTSTFDGLASITDQTGGWLSFKISGKGSIYLFEKLITINLPPGFKILVALVMPSINSDIS